MLKNVENLSLPYQFKTRCYGDSHSYKTANIILSGLALNKCDRP